MYTVVTVFLFVCLFFVLQHKILINYIDEGNFYLKSTFHLLI